MATSAFRARLRLPPVVKVLTVVPVPNWAEPCTPKVEPGSLVLTPTVALPFPTVRVVAPTLKALPDTVQVSQVMLLVKFALCDSIWEAVTEDLNVADEVAVKLATVSP